MIRRYFSIATPATLISFLLTTILMRRRAKTHSRSVDELVHTFSVRSAACVCESDRAAVEKNIVEMLKGQGCLEPDAGHEEGTDMFDQLIRVRLPPALNVRCYYRDALAIGIVHLGEAFDSVASGLYARESLRFCAPRVCFWIAWHTVGAPLFLLLLSTLAKQRLTLDGFCDRVYTFSVFVAVFCAAFGFEVVAHFLRVFSATSDMVLFVFVLATAFCSVAVYLLMAQRSMWSMWSRKAPKHCTLNVDSMMTASQQILTLDLSNSSGCSSTSSSSSQVASHESPSSNGSASEEAVGETHEAHESPWRERHQSKTTME